jgi:hypothetical protein
MFGCSFVTITIGGAYEVYAQESQSGRQLRVVFADSMAEPYTVAADSNNKFIISQSYSWVRDGTSRNNLVSYSIDDGPLKEIPRNPRGNFLLELPADSAKTLAFQSVVQFPVTAITDSEYLEVSFSPPSQTGDNWFDVDSDIAITVSNVYQSASPTTRQQIVGWSFDNSNRVVNNDDANSFFTTPTIKVTAPHLIKFISKTQHYVDLVTSYGTAVGEGWYDVDETASVNIANNDELLIPHVFGGWRDSSGLQYKDNTVSFSVDSPKILTAHWTADYSRLIVIMMVPIAVMGAVILLRKRSNLTGRSSLTVPIPSVRELQQEIPMSGFVLAVQQRREIAQEESAVGSAGTGSYSRELSLYTLQKSIETLERLHASGLISDAKFSRVKEKLEHE